MKYFVAIVLALASYNTYAGLIKWVDSQGVVHYTDAPPPARVKSESIRTSPSTAAQSSASAPAATAPKTIFEKEADMKKEKKAKEEAAQKDAQEKARAEEKRKNCESARSQLQTLQNAPRVTVYNEKGEPSILDDAARAQRITEAQNAVGKFCN